MRKNVLHILIAFVTLFTPQLLHSQDIKVQLKWWHQFQFAGFYAAELKGFYKAEGLNVKLIPGNAMTSQVSEIMNGHADFAVGGSDVLLDYMDGKPLQVIGVIFQHSPYVLISLKKNNIYTPADLIGKKIMLSDKQGWVQLKAVLNKQGIDTNQIKVVPHTWNNNDLINGNVDAMTGYSSVEVEQLEEKGIEVNTIKPSAFGVDFYGDVIFALRKTVRKKEKITNKFSSATFKGWEYAMAHPHEIANYILTLPGVKERGVTLKDLLKEAAKMEDLVVPTLVEVGHMNEGRWQHMLDIYKSLHMVSSNRSLSNFIYNKEKSETSFYLRSGLYALIVGLCILLLLFVYSNNMKRAVLKRTKELESEVKRRKENEDVLKTISDELQVSNNELKQYAYITSHNLRAPVTNLISLTNLFNESELTEKNKLFFEKIKTCTVSVNNLLIDLNEVLSVRKDRAKDDLQNLDFETELLKVQETISEQIIESCAIITYNFSEAANIYFEIKALQSIFQNLLTNAIKYRKPGIEPCIFISTKKENDTIKFTFSDNGIGIDLDKHSTDIFGIHQRFNFNTEGSGLGLYIVKSQVEKYGGTIKVESKENEGAIFIITFDTVGRPI
ncbi:MAG: ABC transporter substrate-binding protein [Ferruginibacter sp.]